MDGYINIFINSFGLFQYFFWKLVLVVPIFVLIFSMIYLFYYAFKK